MEKSSKRKSEMRRAREVVGLIEDSMLDEITPRCRVSLTGHQWVSVDGIRALIELVLPGAEVVTFNPLKSDLRISYRDFAAVELSEPAFAAFANKYGFLGVARVELGDTPPASDVTGETWEGWQVAHREITDAVRLWDRIQSGDVSDCIYHQRRDRWVYHEPGLRTAVIDGVQIKERDPLAVARRLLQQSINRGLFKRAVSRVLWHPDRLTYVFRVLPITLLGCIWWQFAMAFTGEIPPGECEYCHKPIPRGPGAHRVSARFCSQLCRVRNHRKKHSSKKGK